MPPCTAEAQCLADAAVKPPPLVELELDFDPRLERSDREEIVSVDVDCFSFRFCNNLLEELRLEVTGINLNPSLVALWNASYVCLIHCSVDGSDKSRADVIRVGGQMCEWLAVTACCTHWEAPS